MAKTGEMFELLEAVSEHDPAGQWEKGDECVFCFRRWADDVNLRNHQPDCAWLRVYEYVRKVRAGG